MKKTGIYIFLLAFFLLGFAGADDPVNATFETQSIHTETSVVVYGTFSNEASIVWQQSSGALDDSASLSAAERQATMSYSESTYANNGYVEYNKVADLDTGNQVVNQNNFKSTRQLDFVSFNDTFGSVISSESLALDGASMGSSASDRMTCPFGSSSSDSIPAYCNIIEMGSSFSGTAVSMTTVASERHVAATADVPVAMDYSISLAGQGTASAYYRMHLQSARGESLNKSMDIMASEKTTASGTIQSFEKTMSYGSGTRVY
jgi:hypothetical protein